MNLIKRLYNSPEIRHIFLYGVFGVLTTAVNFVVFFSLYNLGVNYVVCNTLAFILAVIFAYFTNKRWVFAVGDMEKKAEAVSFIKFATSRLLTFALDFFGLILLISVLAVDVTVSKISVNVLVIVLNYILSRFFVFNKK